MLLPGGQVAGARETRVEGNTELAKTPPQDPAPLP
jgi:hypothetical protein